MSKDVVVPILLFILVSVLTLMVLPVMAVSMVVGFLILIIIFAKKDRTASQNRLMVRSGLALVVGIPGTVYPFNQTARSDLMS